MDGKSCSTCHVTKPLTAFAKRTNRPDGLRSRCRECSAATSLKRRLARSESDKAIESTIRRYRHIRRTYGIEADEYDQLIEKQQGKCAICKKPLSTRTSVDHNHDTGNIRGILCKFCNPLLGYAKDDITILQAAIDYLRSS